MQRSYDVTNKVRYNEARNHRASRSTPIKGNSLILRIRFFNTVEPVTSFYRDLIPFLVSHGAQIEVILSSAEYRPRNPLEDVLGPFGVQVKYVSAGKIKYGGRLQKVRTMISYAMRAAVWSLFGKQVDLNFFLSQPPLFSMLGLMLKVIRKQSYCCLVMDVYPHLAVQDGMLQANSLATQLLTAISRSVLKRADFIITIGRCMQKYLKEQLNIRRDISVIHNWVNENDIFPVPNDRNQLRKDLGFQNHFIILYSGNIGVSHYFDDLLEVAKRLKGEDKIRFVFIGAGIRRKQIEVAKKEYNLNNTILLPYQPVDNLSHSLSFGDIHFISLRSGFEGLVVPSKTYGAMAASRPIIYQGSRHGEIARLIIEHDIGTVVPLFNPDALEKSIYHYFNNPALVKGKGNRAYKLSRSCYSREQALKNYADLLFNGLKIENI